MVSLHQDKRSVFDKVLDLLVDMCCECRGRSLKLSSLFSATLCFLDATLRGLGGLGGEAPQDGGPGGRSPPESFSRLHFYLVVKNIKIWLHPARGSYQLMTL